MPSFMNPHRRVVWEILPCVLVYLGSPQLYSLSKTCTYLHALIAFKLPRFYDINEFLRQFFPNPAEFRYLQASTGLLISGSQALQFLDRTRFGSSDLDLYVGGMRAALTVITCISIPHLMKYAQVRGNTYFLRRGHLLFQFTSPCGLRKVDLIVATRSAFSAICDFHSTVVMNFISAHCAVSMFPYATFFKRLTMVVRSDRRKRTRDVLIKYASRGFNPPTKPDDLLPFSAGPRLIRDSRTCWILPLPEIPSGAWALWNSRHYGLSLLREDRFCQGMAYWYRMGLSFLTFGNAGRITWIECRDGHHEYCLPQALAGSLLNDRGYSHRMNREDNVNPVGVEAVNEHHSLGERAPGAVRSVYAGPSRL